MTCNPPIKEGPPLKVFLVASHKIITFVFLVIFFYYMVFSYFAFKFYWIELFTIARQCVGYFRTLWKNEFEMLSWGGPFLIFWHKSVSRVNLGNAVFIITTSKKTINVFSVLQFMLTSHYQVELNHHVVYLKDPRNFHDCRYNNQKLVYHHHWSHWK